MMVRLDSVVLTRPAFDFATSFAYPFLRGFAECARRRGFTVKDLKMEKTVRSEVERALSEIDPVFFIGCGHGNETIFTGHWYNKIFESCVNDDKLKGRVVYLLSCLTAVTLGKTIVEKGGKAYLGYKVEFTWISKTYDVMTDVCSWGFMVSAIFGVLPLIFGLTVSDAYKTITTWFSLYIDWWRKSADPLASEVIKWMIYDRDGLTLIGDKAARITNRPPIKFFGVPIYPDKRGFHHLKVVVYSVDGKPLKNHLVEVDYGAKKIKLSTNESGEVESVIPNTIYSVYVDGLQSWEDGIKDNPRQIEIPLTFIDDVLLVAKAVTPVTYAATTTINHLVAFMVIALLVVLTTSMLGEIG